MKRRAFTLVELVIAIGITGMLLVGVFTVSTQIMEVWSRQADDPLFDRHVEGLRRALEEMLIETEDYVAGVGATAAAQNTAGNASSNTRSSVARSASTVFKQPPSEAGVERATAVNITSAPPYLAAPAWPLGFVEGFLVFEDGEGLVLYWRTEEEKKESAEFARRLVLSPWVESVSFEAYDKTNEDWTQFDEPDPEQVSGAGASIFMKINLSHRGQTRQITLTLTDNLPANLNY